MSRFLLALALALCLPASAFAQIFPYPTKTIRTFVACFGSADCDKALVNVEEASNFLAKRVNLRFQVVGVLRSELQIGGDPETRLHKALYATLPHREMLGVGLTLVFLPAFAEDPIIDFQSEEVFGAANDLGNIGRTDSICYVKMTTARLTYRILLHEVGHLLGAEHARSGIMSQFTDDAQLADEYSLESLFAMQQVIARLPSIP